MTEPGAGSDSAGIKATAKPDGDGWILNAHKCPVGMECSQTSMWSLLVQKM